MPIIEGTSNRSQNTTGRFRARANQDTHRSFFCAVEGNNSGAWENARDAISSGIQIGRGQSGRLVLTEFRDGNNKPNDIHYNGMLLRECIATVDEVREKDRREARLSTEDCRDFLESENMKQRDQLDSQLRMRGEMSSEYQSRDAIAEELPAGEAIPRAPRRGRPPKHTISAEPSTQT